MADTVSSQPVKETPYAPPAQEVQFIQEWLKAQGMYQGEVTGTWDEGTWEALKQFQAANNIGQSGQIDMSTKAKLGEQLGSINHVAQDPLDAEVLKRYGPGFAAYLNASPEVAGVLRDAAAQQLPASELQGRLQGTVWWQTTSDAARAWDQQNATDPASADASRQKRATELTQLAGQLGINLNPSTLGQITEDSLRMGMSSSDLANVITQFAAYDPATSNQGELGANVAKLRQAASSYFLKPTDPDLYDQAKRIVSGSLTLDGATAAMRTQAKANFGYLAPEIDQGMTLSDYFAPTKQRIASTLEINPDSVDLMNDPRFSPIINFTDPATGKPRAMTWGEQDQYLKTNYGDNTVGMRQGTANLAGVIRQTFTGAN